MSPKELAKERAIKAFKELRKLGVPTGSNLFTDAVCFTNVRIKKNDLPKYTRAIRTLVLCEREGVVIADIDRMGKVVGWHLSSEN